MIPNALTHVKELNFIVKCYLFILIYYVVELLYISNEHLCMYCMHCAFASLTGGLWVIILCKAALEHYVLYANESK